MSRFATGESVLSRAVRILDAFTADDPILQISEIAARSGLHRATASRLVAELVTHGLLTREDDRRVRVGVRMWELGLRASLAQTLREFAMPPMKSAHAAIGHHIQLGVRDRHDVICLERLSAPGAVANSTRVGTRIPLHASSSGLLLLAFATPELQERVLAGPLLSYSPNTITQPDRLRRTIADVRQRGFAWCRGHTHHRTVGVATPIRSSQGTVVAALSAIIPNDEERKGAVVPVLLAAARDISTVLPNLTEKHRSSRTSA
ncbi:IclR family transcriptional regulator [Nocardia pseudovaccinii]|uniref:IclR family transcriptional regulator n=1 Tax=Nocardia pseudovaccinii TaxID=189540 RepID=UPI0007A375F6|nr:IclR family transcriptional regulator [Nocardia pseudovaccinii]